MTLNKGLKRKRVSQIEEIAFDFNARQDYLTGFHKRKLERTKHAQNIAVKKEKEIKLESRRQVRVLLGISRAITDLRHSSEQNVNQSSKDLSSLLVNCCQKVKIPGKIMTGVTFQKKPNGMGSASKRTYLSITRMFMRRKIEIQ